MSRGGLSATSLVLEFLEAKKLDRAAAALRDELDALAAHHALHAPEPEKPVERGFSKLESLLVRTKAFEAASPMALWTGAQLARSSNDLDDEEDNDSSQSLPAWFDPAGEAGEDEWTDDEALGYSKQPYADEATIAKMPGFSTPSWRTRRNPRTSTATNLSGSTPNEEDEDDEDQYGGGAATGEDGDDESEILSDATSKAPPALQAEGSLLSMDVREPLFEIFPKLPEPRAETAHPVALAPATSSAAGPQAHATPTDATTEHIRREASGDQGKVPVPIRGSGPTGSGGLTPRAVGVTPNVAVSLVAALDSGAEADADTEGGAATEDEAPLFPIGTAKSGSKLSARSGQRWEASKAGKLSFPLATNVEAKGETEKSKANEGLLEGQAEDEVGEEELGEEELGEEAEDGAEEGEASAEEEQEDRGSPDADDGDTPKLTAVALTEEGRREFEEEGEEEEVILESDPDIDPYERAEAEEGKYETMFLKVIHERGRTGFEENKDFPIRINSLIAARYQVKEYLGSAAFSKAVQCLDLHTGEMVCIKIIKNNKDFFDQSLDEIKLLAYLKNHDEADQHNIVHMLDFFYHKEHLFIVCELLRDNLYEFSRYNRENGGEPYFTMPRLRKIAKQCLDALVFTHKLKLIHCDLKPENILIKSYSRCEVKVIDFGSSCFSTDHLSSYVQSRSYRAPEVVLGLPYDEKIDMWSLGAILAELLTGYVLFQNDSVASMLARISGILGPFPKEMLLRGRHSHKYFVQGVVFERGCDGSCNLLRPKVTSLRKRLHTDDELFLSFVGSLLRINPKDRPTAAQALQHPWIATDPYGWPPADGSGTTIV